MDDLGELNALSLRSGSEDDALGPFQSFDPAHPAQKKIPSGCFDTDGDSPGSSVTGVPFRPGLQA
jgi:hypothetical protein